MVGTDSTFLGEKPSPRTYGSFPRILGQFVRDEGLLSLEEAVRKMTAAPAARLGLSERGLLRDGFTADLVVFDPARVRANATYDEPRQFPMGSSTSSSTASWWWTARAHRRATGACAAPRTVMTFPAGDVELDPILVVSTSTGRATSGATSWLRRSIASTAAPHACCAWPGPGSCSSPAASPTEEQPRVTFAVAGDPARVDHAFTMRVANCQDDL